MRRLRALCLDKHGNMLNAWHVGFNPENKPGVPEALFVPRCQARNSQVSLRR